MKGYPVSDGYMGLVKVCGWNTWMLFATEQEYYEYVKG